MEALQARHRKERQDLQSRNTQRRKSATKKNRKAILVECEALEHELQENQRREVAELSGPVRSAADAILDEEDDSRHEDGVQDTSKGVGDDDTSAFITSPRAPSIPKPNRQRARLARRAAARETEMQEAAKEAAQLPDRRESERTHMAVLLQRHHLAEKDVRPDGHCLYSAIADQLTVAGRPLELRPERSSTPASDQINHQPDYRKVRRAAADYVRHHPRDFAPFLEEAPDSYAHRIGETAEWGGHLELMAIARSYGVVIHVLQADGPLESIRPQEATTEDGPTLWLAYYRHHYGLGEHYNSLRPVQEDGATKADISA